MKKPFFSGVCTALVTPFKNNRINYSMLYTLMQRQLDAGVEAIVIAGTTGEAPTLSYQEKIDLFTKSKEYAGDQCKIIAGTGTNSTEQTVALSQAAQQAGADALLVVSPYYNKPNADGLTAHYCAVAESADIPIILYNVPSRTGVDIPVSVYKELSSIKNIIGVKEAGQNIAKHTRILSVCGPDFYVWSGNDDQIVPSISIGGSGVISVLSNICPEETVKMANAALLGDYSTAAEMQRKFMPLIDLLFSDTNPSPVKLAMKYIGYDCGDCRLPLAQATKTLSDKLKASLQ